MASLKTSGQTEILFQRCHKFCLIALIAAH
jgi:hypothetical protein